MLEIKNLNYSYPQSKFGIKDINLTIEKSTVHALVGENGAGKSTLFFNILGLNKPDSGQVLLDGKEVIFKKKELRDYRTRVNLVMQNPDKQIFYSNVRDDILFPLRNLKRSEEFIETKLKVIANKLEIEDLLDRPAHALSYGQKKRVAIAGVLAMEPDYILFDEPTAGLDPRLTENMTQLIKALADEGVGILISSHDMDFIYDICTHASVLSHGQILASGTKDQVFCQKDLLENAGLKQPTIAKIKSECDLPNINTIEDIIEILKK